MSGPGVPTHIPPMMFGDGSIDAGPMDVDDLFGDGAGVGVGVGVDVDVGLVLAPAASATNPPSKALLQRVDELRRSGCVRGLAWSPGGTIANISADATAVELRFLRAHPDTGEWALSEPTTYSPWEELPQGSSVIHLIWAPSNNPELAIIDNFGRIAIAAVGMALNKPTLIRKWDSDPLDDMHAIVGCHTLAVTNQQKPRNINPLYGPAQRKGSGFAYGPNAVRIYGPSHPFPLRSTFVFVTANGTLKVIWIQLNNTYEETTLELESITSADDIATHAAICSDRGNLLVVLATVSKQLRLFNVAANFTHDKDQRPPLHLALTEKHLAVTNWLQSDISHSHLDHSMSHLSHLELVPSTSETVEGQKWTNPSIIAVRSYLPGLGAPLYSSHGMQTIVDKWEVLFDQPQKIHPAFLQLAAKRGAGSRTTGSPCCRVRKLPPIVYDNKVLVDLAFTQYGKAIAFAFHDGSLNYRDSQTFDELYREQLQNNVWDLNSLGFVFPEQTPCLQVAFSPSKMSYVQICEDRQVKWQHLEYLAGDLGSSMSDTLYSNAVAVLALSMSNCTTAYQNLDDIFAVARKFKDKDRLGQDTVMEIIKCLHVIVDYAENSPHHDKLMRDPYLPVCLSFMAHLGFKGYFESRNFANKLSTITLNSRLIIVIITLANNAYQQQSANQRGVAPLDDPDVVDALTGCAEWSRDLLSWLCHSLFELLRDQHFMELLSPQRFPEMCKYLTSRGDICLHLCLCSSTRTFLAALCRRLEHLYHISTRASAHFEKSSQVRTPALYQAYKRMGQTLKDSLVKWSDFGAMLGSLGAEILSVYQSQFKPLAKTPGAAGGTAQQQQQQQAEEEYPKRARSHCELTLLSGASPPSWFQPIIHRFFVTHVAKLREGMDSTSLNLFFADFSLIEVDTDDRTFLKRREREGRFVDAFTRGRVRSPVAVKEFIERKVRGAMEENAERVANGEGAPGNGGGRVKVDGGDVAATVGLEEAVMEEQLEKGNAWRRCTRCACVMVDVKHTRPNVLYVVNHVRKCPCGGSWGILGEGTMVL